MRKGHGEQGRGEDSVRGLEAGVKSGIDAVRERYPRL